MGVTAKKYGVSVNFCRKLMIFCNTVGMTLMNFEKNLIF
jgi:hypothetical protein